MVALPRTESQDDPIAQQKQTRQWRDGIVPHFTTWLNGERWLDEPIEAAARSVAPA
jgi:hypothetical protein